jgi:hypothetical protein
VDATADPYFIYVAISLSGVANGAPTHIQTATGTDTTPTLTVTSDTGELVISCDSIIGPVVSIAEGAGETQRWDVAHDGLQGFGTTMAGANPSVAPDLTLDDVYFWAKISTSFAPEAATGKRRIILVSPQ